MLGFAADDVWKCPFCRLKHYSIRNGVKVTLISMFVMFPLVPSDFCIVMCIDIYSCLRSCRTELAQVIGFLIYAWELRGSNFGRLVFSFSPTR